MATSLNWRQGIPLALGALLLALLSLEGVLRWTQTDLKVLRRRLPFNAADFSAHRVSQDPFLHYELLPGSMNQLTFADRPPYTVTIDEHGARYPTHARTKPKGTFRILAFGGSTLYGATVNDEDTIAAVMERRLNQAVDQSTRFEVWNFGTSMYMLSQATHLALQKLDTLSPDLILVQHHNRGPRGWLIPPDYDVDSFDMSLAFSDPMVWREQSYPPAFVPWNVHLPLMSYSALYRSVIGVRWPRPPMAELDYADQLSSAKAELLFHEGQRRKVPVYFFTIPAGYPSATRESIFRDLPAERYFALYREGRDALFYEMHPPAPYLAEFAALILEELHARGVLPVPTQ